MPVHIADRVLQTDLIMARPNSRAQRHQNWPTQHEKKRSADQFMIDLPNQQACLPNHSALHSSWRAHELRVLTHKPKENDGEHARLIHSSSLFTPSIFSSPNWKHRKNSPSLLESKSRMKKKQRQIARTAVPCQAVDEHCKVKKAKRKCGW